MAFHLLSLTTGLILTLGIHAVYAQTVSHTQNCIDTSHDGPCNRGCKPGFYGLHCRKNCSSNCALACSQDEGKCLTGCDPKWFKSNCTKQCIGYCIDDICDMRNGECIHGCLKGYYGSACNMKCSDNCTDGKCDEFGGCTCREGVEDKACYLDCSDNCLEGLCHVDPYGRLKCSKGCQAGRTGPFCQEWCPGDCTNCTSEGSCTDRNVDKRRKRDLQNCFEKAGNECICCEDGWRGRLCDIKCPACRYRYDKKIKKCIFTCDGGSYGEICHLSCPENCARAFNGRSGCVKETGKCHSGCLQGYYGPKCQENCSINCLNTTCFQNNGSCAACERNKYGPQCENTCGHCKGKTCGKNGTCTCEDGYYGMKCKHKCADQCKSDICKIEYTGSHFCAGACVDGFTGDDCLSKCPGGCKICSRKNGTCTQQQSKDPDGQGATTSSNPLSLSILIILVILVVFVAVCVVVGIIFIRKKRKRPKTQDQDEKLMSVAKKVPEEITEEADGARPDSRLIQPETQHGQVSKMVTSGSQGTGQVQEVFVDNAKTKSKTKDQAEDVPDEKANTKNVETVQLHAIPESKQGNQQHAREVKLPSSEDKSGEDDSEENGLPEVGLKKKERDSAVVIAQAEGD